MPAEDTVGPEALPSTFEMQAAIVAAARASGRPLLDAGRGQPNWLATEPRAGFFRLGELAVAEAAAASPHPLWGEVPPAAGIARRITDALAGDEGLGSRFLAAAIDFGVTELGFEPDAWVHELVRAILGAGYPTPTRMLHHLEQVMERYLVDVTGSEPGPPGRFHVFGTEGGAAAMAYVFKTLQANHIVKPGDAIAITTPIFTPYLQIPVLESFGFRVVALRAAHSAPYRFDDAFLEQLLDPTIKVFFVVNPGNPDSRAIRPEKLIQLRDLVLDKRPDLVIVADTVYATFVDGFRSTLADLPRHVICLHSFSKNYGATGNRLGFVAVHADTILDELIAGQPHESRQVQADRYSIADVGRELAVVRVATRRRQSRGGAAQHRRARHARPGADGHVRPRLPDAVGVGLRAWHPHGAGHPPRCADGAARHRCPWRAGQPVLRPHRPARGGPRAWRVARWPSTSPSTSSRPRSRCGWRRRRASSSCPARSSTARAGTCGCRWRRSRRPS